MSDHFVSFLVDTSQKYCLTWTQTIPFAVLGASLLGSGHCVAMCGGLITTVARNRREVCLYHVGRLFGYCSLGAVAGLLGETLFRSNRYSFIPWFSTGLLAIAFIFLGIRLWRGQSLHLFHLPRKLWQKLAGYGSAATGLLSAFLPCGWLHAFILGAVGTQTPALGALYLLFFWAGTLPALSVTPWVTRKFLQPISKRAPKLSAVVFIAIGISTLGMKIWSMKAPESCHSHKIVRR